MRSRMRSLIFKQLLKAHFIKRFVAFFSFHSKPDWKQLTKTFVFYTLSRFQLSLYLHSLLVRLLVCYWPPVFPRFRVTCYFHLSLSLSFCLRKFPKMLTSQFLGTCVSRIWARAKKLFLIFDYSVAKSCQKSRYNSFYFKSWCFSICPNSFQRFGPLL